MKKQKRKKKAFLAVLLSAAVICQTFPTYSLAAQGPDGICPHHTEHTEACGYREATACQFVCEECKNIAAESERLAAEAEKAVQESQQKIDNVQSLISALPETEGITAENLEDVKAQLAAIEAAKAELDETQQAALNLEKYTATVERIAALETEPQKAPADTQEAGNEPTENDVASVTINGVTTYYENLGDAITDASNETAVITLLKDTTYSNIDGISIYGNVTFKGNHTVDNGDSWEELILYCYGSVKIEEGIYKDTVLYSEEGGNAEIIGGALKRADTNAGTVIIRGGTIDASSCSIDANASITVTGGTIEMLTGYKGNITIKQGTINSLYAKGASINIMGGTINQIKGSEGINYNPESIASNKTELLLEVGKSEKLTATVTPNISAPGFPVWESSDTGVATVNNGTVTAVAPGEATITVKAGNKTATCKVTVAEDYVATVTIDGVETYCSTLEETFEIANGNTATIKLLKSIIDEKSEIKSHGVISSGNITLDMNGHTLDTPLCSIAVDGGTLIITGSGELDKVGAFSGSGGTVILESGKVEAVTPAFGGTFIVRGGSINSIMSSNATIEFQPGELLLNKDTLSLEAGKSEQLSATVNPSISVPGFGYSWESSDTGVATVNNGTVTAVGAGEATITVKAGNKTATCKVTVEDYVATVTKNGQTMSYYTLKEAFESIGENDIAQITLLKDIDEKIEGTERNESYTCRGDITLNGGGYLLKGEIRVSEGSRLLLQNISIASGVAVYGRLETGEGTEIYDITPKSGTTSITVGSVRQLRCKGGTTEISGGEIETFEHLGGSIIISGGTISRVGRLENPENVTFLADRIELSQEAFSLDAGETQNLTATVYDNFTVPEELFSDFTVTWESDNEQVASVDQNGTVTAKAGGTATITAKAGGKKASCAVTVTEDVASVTIGNQTQNYTDLDNAAEAVSGTGGTLTLLKNVSGRTQPLELSGPMTFDLGGHTLSGSWNDGAQGVVVINVGNVQVTNGKVKTEALATRAVNVEEGAILSGDAEYLGNNALRTKGIVSGGTFKGKSAVFENGTISGGIFEEIVSLSGSVQGGCFKDVMVDGGPEGLAAALVAGYVGYNNDGVVVWDHQTQGNTLDNFTGEVKAHTPHTYDFTTHEDGNGNYTYSEGSCPICGITAPKGAAYTVTIPKTAQLSSDTEVSVNNSLSQEKTVTVSVNEKQVTLTRENDLNNTKIVSAVTFDDISVTKGETYTEKVIFAPPVYNNNPDALIPAGTYKGTLTFTIGMQ